MSIRQLGWFALLAMPLAAHDIPNDITLQAFLKPEGRTLRMLVRVPLRAMRDMEFPQRGEGYMDLVRSEPFLRDAATLWISDAVTMYENDRALPKPRVVETRISLESDKSFGSYEEALKHVTGAKLSSATTVVWDQTLLDILFEYPIQSDRSRFSFRSSWARLGIHVVTVIRYVFAGGAVRAFEFAGDPGLVRLDPGWLQAAGRFVRLGFLHILDGTDHLLFLFCLVIPFRRLRALVPVVTAFTVAHSITLIASAYGMAPGALWFPPLIETLIAASIVYMALENIVRAGEGYADAQNRWMIAFGFGLVHGFGFSFALRETLQFAGTHLLTSLLAFNIGVELGQLLVLLLCVPLLDWFFGHVVRERMGVIILSALVAHTGWHWMTERGAQLSSYRYAWPVFDDAFAASAARAMILVVLIAAVFWLIRISLAAGRRVSELQNRTPALSGDGPSSTELASRDLRESA